MNSLLIVALQILAALLLDRIFGEFTKYHPLVGFGNLANKLEARFNRLDKQQSNPNNVLKIQGAVCSLVLVLPLPLLFGLVANPSIIYLVVETLILYLAIGQKSLCQHAMQIFTPLLAGDIKQARHYTSYMVSRDTSKLTESDMSRATVESVLENGHDAVIASLFYFLIGGAPLVILHRLVNTLDAMWGYKTAKFLHFGWFAAKFDDFLGFFSACFTSVLYLCKSRIFHNVFNGLSLAWQQSNQYKSKNGGLCMSAGAQTLGISLGGSAYYHGQKTMTVTLGKGRKVAMQDIPLSIKLVNKSVYLLVACLLFIGLILQITTISNP
ncbi:adenosylcobinamide-phosphate synthase CbiB [Paraglaciecola sp. L3A3]|uniref:adenosylcobinamide-phosphate synthase CbiB n=1 Tax=Paraglaciecola sp. L3A3 TaxID=2686358 RepID=UPI00131DA6B0|nr:adenosylcobinamide-phosphate synthase CbiB [Paraglaciecola sp. L3A3]